MNLENPAFVPGFLFWLPHPIPFVILGLVPRICCRIQALDRSICRILWQMLGSSPGMTAGRMGRAAATFSMHSATDGNIGNDVILGPVPRICCRIHGLHRSVCRIPRQMPGSSPSMTAGRMGRAAATFSMHSATDGNIGNDVILGPVPRICCRIQALDRSVCRIQALDRSVCRIPRQMPGSSPGMTAGGWGDARQGRGGRRVGAETYSPAKPVSGRKVMRCSGQGPCSAMRSRWKAVA